MERKLVLMSGVTDLEYLTPGHAWYRARGGHPEAPVETLGTRPFGAHRAGRSGTLRAPNR